MIRILTTVILSTFLFCAAYAKSEKPIITVLHAGTMSSAGEEFSYPKDGKAKLILAQVILPVGAVIPMHTHPSPVIVHIIAGELTSERANGDRTIYKAGDSFIEAPNSPHKVTNTGKRPAILHGVFVTVEGHGPLTIFEK
mgnify:FL=1